MIDESGASAKLASWLQPGNTVRKHVSPGNIGNQTMHIRAVVDGHQVVYRVWDRRRRYWRYRVEDWFMFEVWFTSGVLSKVSSKKRGETAVTKEDNGG